MAGLKESLVFLNGMGIFLMFMTTILAIGNLHDTAEKNNKMLKKIQEKLGIQEEKK